MECKGIFKFDDIWKPNHYIISVVTNIIHTYLAQMKPWS